MKRVKVVRSVIITAFTVLAAGCGLGVESWEDPSWGTCWVADPAGGSVTKLAPACDEVSALNVDIDAPTAVLVDTYRGVCWAADGTGKVVLLSSRAVIQRTIYGFENPTALGLFPKEGSVWVLDAGKRRLVKLSAEGDRELEVGGFTDPGALACDPIEGDAYVVDGDKIVRVNRNGAVVGEFVGFSGPADISFDGATQTLWVCDTGNGRLVKLDREGNVKFAFADPGFPAPSLVDVNPVTGAVYAVDNTVGFIIKINAAGEREPVDNDDYAPTDIAANDYDDSVWVADANARRVVKLNGDLEYINHRGGFFEPVSLSPTPRTR